MLARGMHFAHAGRWRVGLLQRLEDGIWRDVGLLAVLGLALSVLYRLSPPWLVFVVGVVLLVLHSQTLCLLHKRALLSVVEESENGTESCALIRIHATNDHLWKHVAMAVLQ